MKELYHANCGDPPRPKNMPPDSGKIAWARSIITRIKTPIDKFKEKPGILVKDEAGRRAATDYVHLAQLLTDTYECAIYDKWEKDNQNLVLNMLRLNILKSENEGSRKRFKVNFDPKLKVIIREAKFLDRIGKQIPDTIINIALQEKDYSRHIDKLN
jgi:dynein heavy chain, axonemal